MSVTTLPELDVYDRIYNRRDIYRLHTLVEWRDEAKAARKRAKVARLEAEQHADDGHLARMAADRQHNADKWAEMIAELSARIGK
jgi:hypothetical protein